MSIDKKDLIKLAKIAKGGPTKDLLFFEQLEKLGVELGEKLEKNNELLQALLDRPTPEFPVTDLSELKTLLEEIRDKKQEDINITLDVQWTLL